MLGDGRLINRH